MAMDRKQTIKQGLKTEGSAGAGRVIMYSILLILGTFFLQALVILGAVIVVLCFQLLHRSLLPMDLSARYLITLMQQLVNEQSMVIYAVYAFLSVLLFGYLYWGGSHHRGRLWDERSLPYVLMTGFGANIVMTICLSGIAALFPSMFEGYKEMMNSLQSDVSFWTIAYVVVLGPFSEELIFRGLIFSRARGLGSFWWANVCQAFFFGLFHMNLIQGAYAFLFGLLLGLIVETTHTLTASILMHMAFNATSELLDLLTRSNISAESLMSVVLLMAVLCFIAGLMFFVKEYRAGRQGGQDEIPAEESMTKESVRETDR